jgi:hypothetical protein
MGADRGNSPLNGASAVERCSARGGASIRISAIDRRVACGGMSDVAFLGQGDLRSACDRDFVTPPDLGEGKTPPPCDASAESRIALTVAPIA